MQRSSLLDLMSSLPMSTAPVSLTPQQIFRLVKRHRALLLAPAIIGAFLAALSTFVLPRHWSADQGLLIRSDAAGYTNQRLGKFTDLAEMKTVQETLLELAKSQSVVTAVLEEVGPPSTRLLSSWPTPVDIEAFRKHLDFSPPGGAEFGKTEIFYLGVRASSSERAVALVESLTNQLEIRMRSLRDQRAASMVAEVQLSVDLARKSLHGCVIQLTTFEQSVGADLVELRHLSSPNGGQSGFGQQTLAIEAERRQSAGQNRLNEALLVELQAAVNDPTRLVATPDRLLASQPGLRRLKEGLIDAQLAVARIGGSRTPDHPFVLAARQAQKQIQAQLVEELPTTIAGVQLDLAVAQKREAELADQIQQLRIRSASLAGQRSSYAELTSGVDAQTRVLERALQQLADAKSHEAGAASASLLARIDTVEAGVRAIGPRRSIVTAAGGLAGLILGASLLFVFYGPEPQPQTPIVPVSAPVNTTPTSPKTDPVHDFGYADIWSKPPASNDFTWQNSAASNVPVGLSTDVSATTDETAATSV